MPYFLPLFYLWEGVCPFCPRWWWWLQRWRWWWLWWRRRRGGGRVALDRRAKDKSPPCRWKVTTLHLPPHPRKISSASILQEHVFDNIDNRSKRVVSSISDGDERRSREGKNGRTFPPLEKPQAPLEGSQPSRGGVGDVWCMIVLFWRTCSITVTPLSQWVVYRALRACFWFYAFKECQICSLVGRLFLRIHLKEEEQFGVPALPDDFYQVWNPTALCISFSECFHIDSSLMYNCHNWQIDIDAYMYLYLLSQIHVFVIHRIEMIDLWCSSDNHSKGCWLQASSSPSPIFQQTAIKGKLPEWTSTGVDVDTLRHTTTVARISWIV